MVKIINRIVASTGFKIVPQSQISDDLLSDSDFMEIYKTCRQYTMTSPERMYALYESVQYLVRAGIAGGFAECGVWKGGSSMIIALTLLKMGIKDRDIFLYDTYDGMSEPGKFDKDLKGTNALILLKSSKKEDAKSVWCYSALEEVKSNLISTGYPENRMHFIKGKVEDTIPGVLPGNLALLRLDTDWYDSTYHELLHLFPLLNSKGVLIIDDFGHWDGAKKAVLQYFQEQNLHYFFGRIDYTGRVVIK